MPETRPRVVVYVTREQPETGADELLVFDLSDEPRFASVVPGGRIEPGETAEDAVVRELLEETGLDVRVVRELGVEEQPSWRAPGFRDENHFVHAVPCTPTAEEWDHVDGAIHCRWIRLTSETSVFGEHGVFLQSIMRKRVVGYVTRGRELLVFDHVGMPDVPTQLPTGRVDAGENLVEGLRREVEEETGVLIDCEAVLEIAGPEEFALLYGPSSHENHAFHAPAPAGGPSEWEHRVAGTGTDATLVFACRWVPLDECPPLWGRRDPLVDRVRDSFRVRTRVRKARARGRLGR
jgi:ADP-ribose pyrophosphatase YjhB (NUDIX family)